MVIKNGSFVAKFVNPMLASCIQPHGYDLHIESVHEHHKDSYHAISEESRPQRKFKQILMHSLEYYEFKHGKTYHVEFKETVTIPNTCVAFTTQRSSLMRNGVILNVGVWDAGYNGKGSSILLCFSDLKIHKDMGIAQLIFMEAEESSLQYNGIYQHENIR
jgi:dUTP pyrophosphatase